MKLSANFHRDEFITSQTAARRGIDNTPPAPVLARLKNTAKGLEKVRAVIGKPILISSGYRSPALNKAVGGSATSDHMNGDAADFISPGFGTPIAICRAIVAAGIKFDQLIEEGTWVHISFGPRMRGQILTMRNGKYTAGLR
ncbi:D-Ala-D-Ala carboxypeptidase family metallohydrolase [Phenylobacterium sp.]|uniref:D-Ala-D-Ala carboxypeptidase family metallohydrolase n=1 Tax=Phenylobacterium sp. TaxID=1871053 RepID=UPI002604E4E5|nr:D-Ala-D-Ala carboxypeptidase family metallohydrolase [Phenylobacterium sp.]